MYRRDGGGDAAGWYAEHEQASAMDEAYEAQLMAAIGALSDERDLNFSSTEARPPPSEALPLKGTKVLVLSNVDGGGSASEGETGAVASTIEALGGSLARTLSEATHAVWVQPGGGVALSGGSNLKRGFTLTRSAEDALLNCRALDVPVVDAASWLERLSCLRAGQHWSDVDVSKHVPAVVTALEYNFGGAKMAAGVGVPTNDAQATNSMNMVEAGATIAAVPPQTNQRDEPGALSRSLSETLVHLVKEDPDTLEEESIRRAMELSMLDFALVYRKDAPAPALTTKKATEPSPHEILGVTEGATTSEIKAAYRRRALETHPDKGGSPGEFEAVARAYRSLLNPNDHDGLESGAGTTLKGTAHWDSELREHRGLVRELYQNHGENVEANVRRQESALEALGLQKREAGTSNRNEKNELIRNSCFYLSLAASYLHGIGALTSDDDGSNNSSEEDGDADKENSDKENAGDAEKRRALLREADDALIGETALQLKRTIEAAVVSAHPEWAARGMVGEEVQAFSDFLVYVLDSSTLLSDWAVAVFDTVSGFVDVYKGKNYSPKQAAASNTLTLRFEPGHYQALVPATVEATRPSLDEILASLDEVGVFYVVTDGAT